MTRLLILCFLTFQTFALAQPVDLESGAAPMGPFQLAQESDFSGQWLRHDGTYRLSIHVQESGVTAAYFNPKSVHVESSDFVAAAANGLTLSVVLRDEGYPGSLYELSYAPEYDALIGQYTIPGQAPGEVYFERMSRTAAAE